MRTQPGIGCVCSSLQPGQRLFSDGFTCEAADKEGRGAHNCFINFADALRKSIAVIDLKKEPPPRLLGPSVWALRCQTCGRVSPRQEVRGLCCGPHNSDTRAHASNAKRGRAVWAWNVSVQLFAAAVRKTQGVLEEHHRAKLTLPMNGSWQWCVYHFKKRRAAQ